MAKNEDPTKARWYVIVDLAIKSISAIGLIVLGIAGWLLQSNAQREQGQIRIRETNARLYLPPLQALAQIQVAFSLEAEHVDLSINRKGNEIVGWRLRYLLDSLYFPEHFDDNKVSITPLGDYGDRQKARGGLKTSYKQAASLAAELEAMMPIIRDICRTAEVDNLKYMMLKHNPPALYFAQNKSIALPGDKFIPIDAENANEWDSWLPSDGVFLSTLCGTNFQPLYQELAKGASTISISILKTNPELAEKAVTIRVDSLNQEKELFGFAKIK